MPEELRRDRELAGRKDSKLSKELIKEFERIRRGFENQAARADTILDLWDQYNCILGQNQAYNGNAQLFVPIVKNAVNARKTRFVNQIFPTSGRYVDAASDDGSIPHAIVALLEHYVRKTKLRTEIMMALCRNGDLEGQYNLELGWETHKRHVATRVEQPVEVSLDGMGSVESEDEKSDTIVEEVVEDSFPTVEVVHDSDVLVRPATADSIPNALAMGGSITILKRWTRATLEQKIASGEIMRVPGEFLLEQVDSGEELVKDMSKVQVDAAGIKGRGAGRHILVYKTWKVLEVEGEKRLCLSYYGGGNLVLSCKLNPFWNDRCSLLSVPVDKIAGSFKGDPPMKAIQAIQYHANDIANQAADSATYGMCPVVLLDPAKNPNSASLLINLGAVWSVDPASLKVLEFPKLWQDGIALIQADTQLAFMTVGVNPAMLPQQTGKPGAKRNQAEVALETTVDILTTAEACSVLEEGMLTPLVEMFAEYDSQFRDDDITIRAYGELGLAARMETIKPRQFGNRFTFTWFGVEQARNAAQMQQQIAWLNVAMTPQMQQALNKQGYSINPAPVLEVSGQNIFGARLGRQVLVDARAQLSVDPELENLMMNDNFDMPVRPNDDDQAHMKSHRMDMQANGDPTGMIRVHIDRHLQSMQMKAAAMMQMQQMQAGGGAPQAPGGPATPAQPGAVPAGPRLIKGPPGAMAPDRMSRAGVATAMPRRM